MGFEPMTFSLQVRCDNHYAKEACFPNITTPPHSYTMKVFYIVYCKKYILQYYNITTVYSIHPLFLVSKIREILH